MRCALDFDAVPLQEKGLVADHEGHVQVLLHEQHRQAFALEALNALEEFEDTQEVINAGDGTEQRSVAFLPILAKEDGKTSKFPLAADQCGFRRNPNTHSDRIRTRFRSFRTPRCEAGLGSV